MGRSQSPNVLVTMTSLFRESGEPIVQKFLFDTLLDEQGETKPTQASKIVQREKTLHEAGYQLGMNEGYTQGVADGLKTALTQREAQTEAFLSIISQRCKDAVEELESQREAVVTLATSMTENCLVKVMPLLRSRFGRENLCRFILETLQNDNPPTIRFVTHPETCRWLKDRLNGTVYSKAVFGEDDTLSPDDCRMLWEDTCVERIQSLLIEKILDLLKETSLTFSNPIGDHHDESNRSNS
jgi:hypothetical protein